jgi:hypothetical protein
MFWKIALTPCRGPRALIFLAGGPHRDDKCPETRRESYPIKRHRIAYPVEGELILPNEPGCWCVQDHSSVNRIAAPRAFRDTDIGRIKTEGAMHGRSRGFQCGGSTGGASPVASLDVPHSRGADLAFDIGRNGNAPRRHILSHGGSGKTEGKHENDGFHGRETLDVARGSR